MIRFKSNRLITCFKTEEIRREEILGFCTKQLTRSISQICMSFKTRSYKQGTLLINSTSWTFTRNFLEFEFWSQTFGPQVRDYWDHFKMVHFGHELDLVHRPSTKLWRRADLQEKGTHTSSGFALSEELPHASNILIKEMSGIKPHPGINAKLTEFFYLIDWKICQPGRLHVYITLYTTALLNSGCWLVG